MEVISRPAARESGLTRYFTNKSCRRGHLSERMVSNTHCVSCLHERTAAARKSESGRKRRAAQTREYMKQYRASEKYKEYEISPRGKCRVLKYMKSEKGKEKRREWVKSETEAAKSYRVADALRTRLRNAMNGRAKVASAIQSLGCSVAELRSRLEAMFQDGMSWENYGEWHIDHIRPLSSFDLSDKEQVKSACHFTNLQPLWAKDNISKGAKSVENWQRSDAA